MSCGRANFIMNRPCPVPLFLNAWAGGLWMVTRLLPRPCPWPGGFCRLRNSGTQEPAHVSLPRGSRPAGGPAPFICSFVAFLWSRRRCFARAPAEIDTAVQLSCRFEHRIMHKNPTARQRVPLYRERERTTRARKRKPRCGPRRAVGHAQDRRKPNKVRVSLDPCCSVPADPNHFWELCAPCGPASGFRAYPDSCTVARARLH